MSRINKIPINIPTAVKVETSGKTIKVSGSKGELDWVIPEKVILGIENNMVEIKGKTEGVDNLLGLTHSIVANMIKGVTDGWTKVLELNGTGFRANTSGSELNLALGFSHPVVMPAPVGISFEVKENKITVKGADKALVGEVAAKIRALKPADPYKNKGFKYEGEMLIKKAGKAAKAGAAATSK